MACEWTYYRIELLQFKFSYIRIDNLNPSNVLKLLNSTQWEPKANMIFYILYLFEKINIWRIKVLRELPHKNTYKF